MEKLTDYILTLEHIIPTTLCDNIIKEYQSSKEWIGSTVYLKDDVPITAKDVRNCTGINMSHKEVIDKNKNIRKLLDNEVFECAKKSIEEYNKKFKRTCVTQDTGYNLLRYEPGGFYLEHVDSLLQEPRVISCSFILNNNFKGGEFSFFDNKIRYSLNKGSVIMFPSNFLYPHQILPVTEGVRFSIVTWFK